MGQVLHGSATTIEARGPVADVPTGPKNLASTVLAVEEEAIIEDAAQSSPTPHRPASKDASSSGPPSLEPLNHIFPRTGIPEYAPWGAAFFVLIIAIDINRLGGINGGWGEIRTHGTLAGPPVFKTGALNHSATHPVAAPLIARGARRVFLFRTCGERPRPPPFVSACSAWDIRRVQVVCNARGVWRDRHAGLPTCLKL